MTKPTTPRSGKRGGPRILHLTLHRKWFDEIATLEKRNEYREVKPFWTKRFIANGGVIIYDEIHFRNGYAKNAPWMRAEWGGLADAYFSPLGDDKHVYDIGIGKILEIKNWSAPQDCAKDGKAQP